MEGANQLVQFSLSKGGLSVSGSVKAAFYEQKVLPVIEKMLTEIGGLPEQRQHVQSSTKPNTQNSLDMSVKMIASKLGATSGSDVLKAGAISLSLVSKNYHFSRKELLEESQKAVGYWKKNISSNASKYIKTLISSGFLIESASGQLSLDASAEADVLALLQ